MNPISIERHWLAAVIAGVARPPIANGAEQALFACAVKEGVVTLVDQRLSEDPCAPAALRDLFSTTARESAVVSMLRESECRRVLEVLHAAQIPVLLMKGSALAWWLYPAAHLRECCDVDLLFSSREQAENAARLLVDHGYALHYQPPDLSYELLCRREIGSIHVDLDMHWRLVNAPLFAETFEFEALQAASIPLPRLDANARGLGPVHAFMHACIHRAANVTLGIGDGLKWLYDLHLLGRYLSGSEWSELLHQCHELGLSGVCAAGIDAAEQAFGNAMPKSDLKSLQQASTRESLDAGRLQDWKYMQRRNLAALPSLRKRARWLWQRLFPPLGYLRELYGADRSVASLWMERVRRAIARLRS